MLLPSKLVLLYSAQSHVDFILSLTLCPILSIFLFSLYRYNYINIIHFISFLTKVSHPTSIDWWCCEYEFMVHLRIIYCFRGVGDFLKCMLKYSEVFWEVLRICKIFMYVSGGNAFLYRICGEQEVNWMEMR